MLAACVNNNFALLEIAYCTAHLAQGGKKNAKYIAKIIMPLIQLMESEEDMHKKTSPGIVDLVFFDGASNVQNAGEILRVFNPCVTVRHGAKHVALLFFSDVYTRVKDFQRLSAFAKKIHNIFGLVRHSPLAMFKKYSRQHNHGVYLGFIKPSKCWMAGEHIAILRLLRLKNALKSTIASKEFIDLCVFHSVCTVLMNPEFWMWALVMCHALYAPMQVLCLADQKLPAMDKLFFYVLQTDQMLPKYVSDAEEHARGLLIAPTLAVMDSQMSAGLSDDSGSDREEGGDNNDGDNSTSSVQLATQNSNDDDSDDDEQQVLM